MQSPHYRLFIALEIPEQVKQEIERAQAELRQIFSQSAVRWTRCEQFHLTLRFLGNVESALAEALVEAVRSACRDFGVLSLHAEHIGFFPNLKLPRVIWAGIHDSQARLAVLQRALNAATNDLTTEPAEERFTGHVTLGRIKQLKRSEAKGLAKLCAGIADRRFGEWTADKLHIFRSELSASGAVHTPIAIVPL